MSNPKVSIISPVYKAEKYLKECVDSILCQTFTDFELILVDDCSPDNSPQMCDEYAKQDARVKVIHNNPNQGSVKSYKAGVDSSKGDYIQFVDSDDWIENDTVERLYKRAASEDYDIVYSDVIRFEGKKLANTLPFDTRGMEKSEIVINMIENKFTQYLVNRLFKRHLFNNIVWPDFQFREDTVICIQLFLNAEKIGYEYSILYHYRYTFNSISNKKGQKVIQEHLDNLEKFHDIMKKRPDYETYKQAIKNMLDSYRTNDRYNAYYYIKRFFLAFVPYGIIALYRRSKGKEI